MLAMHIPDGFLDAPVSLLAGVVAVIGIALCLRSTSRTLDERQVPVVGLVAAFVFAAQMLNFPVANGTSGHLLGAVLALSARTRRMVLPKVEIDLDVFAPGGGRAVQVTLPVR